MSTTATAVPSVESQWVLPSRGRVGMLSLIAAEFAIFIIFVVAYLFYIGKKSCWSDAEGRARGPDLRHRLSPVQQPDDSCRGGGSAEWQGPRFQQTP